jgi:hypothetical protein
LANQPQQGTKPAAASEDRRKTAAEEFLDCFEALASLVRSRHGGYTAAENKLAKTFLAKADDMIARARKDVKEGSADA